MKKLLCFLLCLTLIFSSISLCFAQDWSATDSQNLSNAASRLQTIITTLNTTNSTLNIISNRILDINNALFDDNHSVAYWTNAILTWMSPIYYSLTSVPSDLSVIQGLLGYPTTDSSGTTWNSYIRLITPDGLGVKYLSTPVWTGSGWTIGSTPTDWYTGMQFGLNKVIEMHAYTDNYLWPNLFTGNTSLQYYTNPITLQTANFTPTSTTNGIYTWLSKIQEPVARLSYVLASPERIEAQEAAAANEESVVDNFIDSSGDGAASPSDIGSVSDLSSGYKQNFGTDASPSGIFDIFNADHASWFSQETKNQLDTTTPTRLTKGSQSETPLLDKQIEDIYDALGVKQP